jgi:Holliday junction resolvase RusA-like endonuclease
MQTHKPIKLNQEQMIELISKKRGVNLSSVTELAEKFKPSKGGRIKRKPKIEIEKKTFTYSRWTFTLPFPPSMNRYYGRSRYGAVFIKPEGKKFRKEAEIILEMNGLSNNNSFERIRAGMVFFPIDKRKRDWDNIQKATWDCLKKRIYNDDSQIDFVVVGRGKPDRFRPRVEIIIDTCEHREIKVTDIEYVLDCMNGNYLQVHT